MHKIMSKALGIAAIATASIGGYILMQDKAPKLADDMKDMARNMKDKATDVVNDMKD